MFGHVQKRETMELTGRRKREMPHRKFMDAVKEDAQRLVVKGKACSTFKIRGRYPKRYNIHSFLGCLFSHVKLH